MLVTLHEEIQMLQRLVSGMATRDEWHRELLTTTRESFRDARLRLDTLQASFDLMGRQSPPLSPADAPRSPVISPSLTEDDDSECLCEFVTNSTPE